MSEEILNQLAADMNKLLNEPVGSRSVKITDLTPRDGTGSSVNWRRELPRTTYYHCVRPSIIAVFTPWKFGVAPHSTYACATLEKIHVIDCGASSR